MAYKNTPLTFFKWHIGFNPKVEKPNKVPMWVDFLAFPIDYYPSLKVIGAQAENVLGQNTIHGYNPEWDPQLLIEVDLSQNLQEVVIHRDQQGNIPHS